jgi:hypothetical protein
MLIGKLEGKRPLRKPRRKRSVILKWKVEGKVVLVL